MGSYQDSFDGSVNDNTEMVGANLGCKLLCSGLGIFTAVLSAHVTCHKNSVAKFLLIM